MGQPDKDLSDRLQKIESEWAKEKCSIFSESMRFYDLRIMLEHFPPLQQLIREIATDQLIPRNVERQAAVAVTETQAAQISEVDSRYSERIATLEKELAKFDQLLAEAEKNLAVEQGSLHTAQQQLTNSREQSQRDQQEIEQLTANLKLAEQSMLQTQAHNEQLELQLQEAITDTDKLSKQVNGLKTELKQSQVDLPILEYLREESSLAQRLGLAELPTNTLHAVVKMVAVLSQRDSLERLWDVLKERCEANNRRLNNNEAVLFQSALEWYNHNWSTRPFQLLMPEIGAAYDFDKQLKSTHTQSGEIVVEVRLPGIADGAGKVICKPIVATR